MLIVREMILLNGGNFALTTQSGATAYLSNVALANERTIIGVLIQHKKSVKRRVNL